MDGPLGMDRLGWQLGVILLWVRMVAVGVRISSGYMMVITYSSMVMVASYGRDPFKLW